MIVVRVETVAMTLCEFCSREPAVLGDVQRLPQTLILGRCRHCLNGCCQKCSQGEQSGAARSKSPHPPIKACSSTHKPNSRNDQESGEVSAPSGLMVVRRSKGFGGTAFFCPHQERLRSPPRGHGDPDEWLRGPVNRDALHEERLVVTEGNRAAQISRPPSVQATFTRPGSSRSDKRHSARSRSVAWRGHHPAGAPSSRCATHQGAQDARLFRYADLHGAVDGMGWHDQLEPARSSAPKDRRAPCARRPLGAARVFGGQASSYLEA